MKNIIIFLAAFCLIAVSCNDSFLERYPTHDMNNNSYWKTASDLKVYNNGIYNLMAYNDDYLFYVGFGHSAWGSATLSEVALEAKTDNFASTVSEHQTYTKIAAGQEIIPNDPGAGEWKWALLRNCNVFFANYQQAEISDQEKNRYAGEVYFFRAWFYMDKAQVYGDVPYVTIPLETDSPELYYPRTPRKQVMDSVLRDLNKAIEFLPESWPTDHPDRVTKWTALALKSRFCLYEGTFRKYHNLGDHESYLKEAVAASEALMESKQFEIYNTGNVTQDYRTLFTSKDLDNNKEIIHARKYSTVTMAHRMSGYIVTQSAGVTKDLVDDYLCLEADGTVKPIALSTIYRDGSIEEVFDNRDPRMAQTILDPRDEKEILRTNNGYPRLSGMSGWASTTGYHFIKHYNYDDDMLVKEESDAPIFRYAEVLLNYAEAKAELGTITQNDLDLSVNLIRKRAGIPDMPVNPVMDPKYASEGLSSLMVEIRRERRIELSFELSRYQDLMRWKKGSYLTKRVLGMRFEDSDRTDPHYEKIERVYTIEVDGKKYIDVFAGTDFVNRVFQENKHYYHPIPVNVISKNPALGQNPNW